MKPPPINSLAAGLMRRALKTAVCMPRGLAEAIYGPAPTNDRGVSLDWQTHVLLSVLEGAGQPELHELGVAEAREVYTRANHLFDVAPRPMHAVEDHEFGGPFGPIPARLYRPRPGRLPVCVFFHGGGFVIGDLDGYDGVCRMLAERGDMVVISVDYRLAPEHPFPDPVDDCVAAFRAIRDRADRLGLDPHRLVVAGDSAGGNLATVLCQELVKEQEELPIYQLLIYPKTDQREQGDYASRELFADGFFLTSSMVDWFSQTYLGDADVAADPRVSPNCFEDLHLLPPTHMITAGFDPLRDEGEAYADRLAQSGVRVTRHCCSQLVHGFVSMGGLIDAAAHAVSDMAEQLRSELRR